MHAAGTDDHEQAVVGPVQDRVHVGATAQDHIGLLVAQRELVQDLRRGHERHDLVDALITDVIEMRAATGHAQTAAASSLPAISATCSTRRRNPAKSSARSC